MKSIFIMAMVLLSLNVTFGQDKDKCVVPPLAIKKIEPIGSRQVVIRLSMFPYYTRGCSVSRIYYFIDDKPIDYGRWQLLRYGDLPVFYCGLPVCFENTIQKDLYYEKNNTN